MWPSRTSPKPWARTPTRWPCARSASLEAAAGEGEKVTVFETSLMCRGSCRDAKFAMSGGLSRAMPGGLTATPADFEKARKYVNPVDVAAQKETRRRERADVLARVGRSRDLVFHGSPRIAGRS